MQSQTAAILISRVLFYGGIVLSSAAIVSFSICIMNLLDLKKNSVVVMHDTDYSYVMPIEMTAVGAA